MIKIKYSWKQDKFNLKVEGHAEYNPGCDIVCAACSILTFTIMQCIKDFEKEGKAENVSIKKEKGLVTILANTREIEPLKCIMRGYDMLENTYPDHVSVI